MAWVTVSGAQCHYSENDGQSMAQKFTFHGQPHERAAAEQSMFGYSLSDSDYADLGGDLLGDATIEVSYNQPWSLGGQSGNYLIQIRTKNELALTIVRMNKARYDVSDCEVAVPNRKTGALILY